MLTLDEAVAKYKAAKTELEDRQRDYWQEPSLPAADRAEKVSHALDAAVRDVALAAVGQLPHKSIFPLTEEGITRAVASEHDPEYCQRCKAEVEINRLFPHG